MELRASARIRLKNIDGDVHGVLDAAGAGAADIAVGDAGLCDLVDRLCPTLDFTTAQDGNGVLLTGASALRVYQLFGVAWRGAAAAKDN